MTRVQYEVVHETTYNYAYLVANGHHFAHLTPRNTASQAVLAHLLEFEPTPAELISGKDFFGNYCQSALINTPHDSLRVISTSRVRVQPPYLEPTLVSQPWETALRSSIYSVEPLDVADMRLPSPGVACLPESLAYARRFFSPERPWLEAMLDLTRQVKRDFIYDPKATEVGTAVAEVFAHKRGVCQDFSHVMLSCLRALQLPARYVSGYILNEPPPGKEKLIGSDASHAWVESYLPGAGWIGFDPTNGKLANTEFITIGWGRDFSDVTPLRGVVLGGGEHELEVRVTVRKLTA
jgi:transglutaminase-like putative cysteine protease